MTSKPQTIWDHYPKSPKGTSGLRMVPNGLNGLKWFEVALFLGVGFFILVIRHIVAENRIPFVLGKDALSMVELPEVLAAGAGYVVSFGSRPG